LTSRGVSNVEVWSVVVVEVSALVVRLVIVVIWPELMNKYRNERKG